MSLLEFADPTAPQGIRRVSPDFPLPAGVSADVVASGTLGALNAFVAATIGARDTLVLAVSGTWVGTISLQGSLDNVTWFTINGPATWLNVSTGASATTVTSTGLWQATVSAIPFVRVTMTSYTSGSAPVIIDVTDGNAMVALDAPLPAGGNRIGGVSIVDGSGNQVSTTGASTPASVNDRAITVTQSPNYVGAGAGFGSTLAAGSTGAAQVKGSAGSLMELSVWNPTSATIYVKLFAKFGAPNPAADVPLHVIPVAAGQAIVTEFGQYGKRFGSGGIGYAVTTGAADLDNTAPAAAGIKISGTYL